MQPASDLPDFDLIATCAFGLEAVVRRELESLQIESTIGESGRVHFRGTRQTIAQANLHLRCADRVLLRLAEFPASDFDALFETVREINWGLWMPPNAKFPVTGRSIKSQLSSVPACQRSVKRAVVDAMMRDHQTATLAEDGPEFKIDIALLKDIATLTIDTTGRSLHRRGYRTDASQAPLKETLAAAMVLLSFWKPDRPLLDPFCGSGTIPIEAARIGHNIAPGITREFAFESWPFIPVEVLADLRSQAISAQIETLDERILGSDLDGRVLHAARDNAARAGVADSIHFQVRDALKTTSKRRFGCLIANPPYGQRIGEERELDHLYHSLPEMLRGLPTWSHYFLTAYPGFENAVGRQADRRRKLYNGRIECTYYQFHGPKRVTGEPDTAADALAADAPTDAPTDAPADSAGITSADPADSTPDSTEPGSQTTGGPSPRAADRAADSRRQTLHPRQRTGRLRPPGRQSVASGRPVRDPSAEARQASSTLADPPGHLLLSPVRKRRPGNPLGRRPIRSTSSPDRVRAATRSRPGTTRQLARTDGENGWRSVRRAAIQCAPETPRPAA